MSTPKPPADHRWWERGVVYQVYPRSFQDSDGDGIGDLQGVIRRLDHLVALGVDVVWLSPIFPSPMADFGYDVADYTGVHPLFGTLPDADALIAAAHARGLKLLLDFVPNHSSDQHPWFLESRSSRSNPKRDWYIWRDAKPDGSPPNNWVSDFGGSSWEWDPATGQYYLHAFLKEQPDLNWRNPDLRAAMYDAMRFWLERGVDGFRVDVLWHVIKREDFADNPPNPRWREGLPEHVSQLQAHNTDQPEGLDVGREMRAILDGFGDRVLIGEIYLPIERLAAWYGTRVVDEAGGGQLDGPHLPFNFHLIQTKWRADRLARLITDYEAALPEGAWPNWVLGNHDRPRIASRVGEAQARNAALLLLTLRGTPTLYQGDELGLPDTPVPPEAVRDPAELRQPGIGIGRDPVRTPIPWDGSPGAGFTTGEPWLPLGPDWRERNVAAQAADPRSMLALHRVLLALRRAEPALSVGAIAAVWAEGDLLRYERRWGDRRLLVLLNLAGTEVAAELPGAGAVLLSTGLERAGEWADGAVRLRADEGLVLALD